MASSVAGFRGWGWTGAAGIIMTSRIAGVIVSVCEFVSRSGCQGKGVCLAQEFSSMC